jgi:hypothetical protein
MIRRFELGPILVTLGALLLLVSLFLDWYGPLSAWDAFEVVDVMLATLAVVVVLAAAGAVAPDLAYVERRWLPLLVLVVAVLVAAEIIDPPPAAADLSADTGAWIAFGAAVVMLLGAVLSVGRVSLQVAVEGRDVRHRVAAVDERQQTTESGAVVAPGGTASPAPGGADPAGAVAPDPSTEPTQPVAPDPTQPAAGGGTTRARRGSRGTGA